MWGHVRSVFRALTSRRDFEAGMSEELRFHIEQYADDLVRSGVPQREAARRACLEFGSLNTVQGDCREARRLHVFDEIAREVRYAARLLRKTPGFTLTALLTLAVCLGANLTIFAVIDSVLLRPLPFPQANRLVTMYNTYPRAGVDRDGSSIANYYERRGHIQAFGALAMYRDTTAIVGEAGSTERERIMLVSPDFLSTVEIGPSMGRSFTEEETTYQTDNVAILSNEYWRQQLSADPHAIGRQIRVDGFPKTVVGVLPPDFRFLSSKARLYFPFSSRLQDRESKQRHSGGNSRQIIARLNSGATIAQAQAQIDAQNAALEAHDPDAKTMKEAGFRTLIVPLQADHVAAIRPTLWLLQAGAFALLLIGAVNLTNLLLIRASGRTKEVAVRQALGASTVQVVREAIVETTLLTMTGAALGLLLGVGGIGVLGSLGADHLPLGNAIVFGARPALVAFAGAIVMGILLAGPIALFNVNWLNLEGHRARNLANAIQSETRGGTAGRAAQRLRHSFVVAQIALALVLLAGTGLLGLSLERAMAVSPGFRPDHVLTGQISLPWKQYPNRPARLAFNGRLLDAIGKQPGVLAVGLISNVPFSGDNGKSAAIGKGRVLRPGESVHGHYSYAVDGDYFRAMNFTLREGRFLTAADSRVSARVCVVDRDFARYYWPQSSGLGQKVFEGSEEKSDAEAFTVVGVVGAVKQAGLTDEDAQGAVYYPYSFRLSDSMFTVVRGSLQPEALAPVLQKIVRQIDPDLPVNNIEPMEARIDESLVARRSPALLAGIFSVIALLLTTIGTYGVLSYAVAQRRREIGVRMALGARPQQIRTQFMYLALRLLTAGIVTGFTGAWMTGKTMQSVLFHVPAFDIWTFGSAAALIGIVTLFACLLPSHRAARISPVEVLADQ
jgi:predicted permease